MISRGYEAPCKSLKSLGFSTLSCAACGSAGLAQCPTITGTCACNAALAATCSHYKGLQKPLQNPHLHKTNNGAVLQKTPLEQALPRNKYPCRVTVQNRTAFRYAQNIPNDYAGLHLLMQITKYIAGLYDQATTAAARRQYAANSWQSLGFSRWSMILLGCLQECQPAGAVFTAQTYEYSTVA